MPTTSSSVRVDFYNGTVKNLDFYALLSDNRSNVTCSLSGSLTNVKDASLVIDKYQATTADKKPFPILPISSVTIEKGSTGRYTYAFTDKDEYSLKLMVVLNDGTNLTGKFSYGNVSDLTAYKFIYRETPDAFVSASFSKPNAVYSGSSIEVTAQMSFLTEGDAAKDARRPKRVRGSFDVLDLTNLTDYNSEALNSYCPEVDYSESGVYTFPSNTLQDGYSYSCTLEAIYDDGYKPWKNVADSVSVFKALTITHVEAFGLGVNELGAGNPLISSVMDVTMETENTGIFTGGANITFKLSQGVTNCYEFTVPAKSGPNPVYNILNNGLGFTDLGGVPVQSTATNGSKYYAFDVTAHRTYTSIYSNTIAKVSNIVSENFVLDVNSLGAVLVDNQWTRLGVVAPSRKVVLDSVLTQQKWNLISENGYLAKFSKNSFFGTGVASGELFEDKDNVSTQFKVEVSQDGGTTFAPVTSLRMKQGAVASSATVDRDQWVDLLDDTPLQNAEGLYPNIPWISAVLGPQQPPIYLMADCDPPSTVVPGIFSLNGVKTKYTADNMTGVKADSTLPYATIPDKDGWLIKNGANITVNNKVVAPKVNLYYYSNPVPGYIAAVGETPSVLSQQTSANSFILSQATGLGLYAVFNQNSAAKQFPFFIAYTTHTGSGDKASWYKSKVFYAPASGNPLNSGLTLAYSGTDDLSFRPDIPAERRVKYAVNLVDSNANLEYASEFVKYLSFQTSGNADSTIPGDFDFQLLETGMFTSHASTGLVSLTYNEYSRLAGIFSLNSVRTNYADVNMTRVKADSTLTVATFPGKDGWLIKNGANIVTTVSGVTKTTAPKVNLYFYDNPVDGYIPANPTAQPPTAAVASKQTAENSFILSQATGLGLYAVFNQNSGAKQYPFFIAYTTQTGTGDKASWYKSNVFYAPASGNPLNSGLTLAYSGTDDLSFRPDIPAERRVKYEVNLGSSKANTDYASEFVNMLSLQTSGNASSTAPGDFDFQLLETGMFTSHASTGLVSLIYNQYTRLVLQVSIVATASTRPTATQSNRIRLMNKVNTPTTGESAIYNITNETLTVTVNNSDAADQMTGVLFTSNLKSPHDNAVVPKSANAINNSFTFDRTNINSQSFSVSTDTDCKFQIAYNVTDGNGGDSDITGLQGPVVTVPVPKVPGRDNYVISNFDYKTINDHDESSFSFDATFNSDNNTDIAGLKCYFNTTADFSSSSSRVMVKDVKRSDGMFVGDTVQSIVVRLDTLFSIFSTWTDLSVGYVEFVPYFTHITGGSDVTEVPSQQTRYGIYNVKKIASVPATLEGGVVQAATTLKWTGAAGNSYNLSSGASDLSATIAASGSDFSYVFAANTLTDAVALTLNLKKQETLPQVAGTSSPLFITLVSKTWYGPVTDVTFTPVSVNTSSMALTVLRNSNDSQLLISHAAATISNSSLLNVTANQLTKAVGLNTITFSSGPGSTASVQVHSAVNIHTIPGDALASVLDLRMRVKAGVKYTSKVGSGTVSAQLNSDSVVLPLGPLTPYRVAGVPSVTSNGKYTVNGGKINIAVSINANGLAVEGLATVVAFISQDSDYTNAEVQAAGVGGTALAVFGPGSTRSYTPSASSTPGHLIPGDIVTTTPENLSDSIGAIESGSFDLTLGTLGAGDASVFSFPTTGFNTTAPIQMILIVTTRLGHDIATTVLTYQAPT